MHACLVILKCEVVVLFFFSSQRPQLPWLTVRAVIMTLPWDLKILNPNFLKDKIRMVFDGYCTIITFTVVLPSRSCNLPGDGLGNLAHRHYSRIQVYFLTLLEDKFA